MKLVLEPQDLLTLLGGEEATAETRERIAGMLLSTVDSEEMKIAIEKRVTEPAKNYVDRVINNAVKEVPQWGGKVKLEGWGAEIIREQFRDHFRQQYHFDDILRGLVQEVFKDVLTDEIQKFAQEAVREVLTKEVIDKYLEDLKKINFESFIREEISLRMRRLGS